MIDTSRIAKAAAETATSMDRWDDEGGAQFPSRKEIGDLGHKLIKRIPLAGEQ
jgi:hypothetical protein